MLEITLKLCLGILLGVISVYGLMANILVIIPVYRLIFVLKKSPIYIISLVNIFADVFNLLLTTFYLTPLILKNAYITNSSTDIQTSLIFGTCFMFCWYLGSLTQIIMAVNRLVVICFKNYGFFTRKLLLLVFLIVFLISFCLTYLAQFGFSCCAVIYDSQILSIRYQEIENKANFSNMFIDVPLNFTCSFTAVVCYSLIVLKIWKARKGVIRDERTTSSSTTNKEYSYAFQFFIISLFYTISWILFRLFPTILGSGRVELYSTVMISISLNNSASAFVYIFFNKEILQCIRQSRFLLFPKPTTSVVQSFGQTESTGSPSKDICASVFRQNCFRFLVSR